MSPQITRAYVIAIDDKFVSPMKVFLTSLVEHGQFDAQTSLVLLYDSSTLSPSNLAHIQQEVLPKHGVNHLFIDCKDIIPTSIKWKPSDHVSKATYYRLFFINLLPPSIERAVYLDIDMVVKGDLTPLMQVPFTEPIAAVNHYSAADEVRMWGETGGRYFNAGLIVFNTAVIRQRACIDRYIQVLETQADRILWHDQDVLNIAHEADWHALPWHFNLTRCAEAALAPVAIEKVRIIHYDGWNKPWLDNIIRPFDEFWHLAHFRTHGQLQPSVSWTGRTRAIAWLAKEQMKASVKEALRHLRMMRQLRHQVAQLRRPPGA
jgi:lipopolysaccharide biosynthesis glycosyltransferase